MEIERELVAWQRERGLERFIARFKRADIKRGSVLESAYGNGNTEEEAIRDYARRISGERLVRDEWIDDKSVRTLDVMVPILVPA